MRPVPIPDARIWADPDGIPLPRLTVGAPRGHEDACAPVEALVEERPGTGPETLPGPQLHLLLALEDGDLDRLRADPHLWLTFWGPITPFALTVPDPNPEQEQPMTNTSTGDPTPDQPAEHTTEVETEQHTEVHRDQATGEQQQEQQP
jgi:hypothetical protein